MAGDQEDTPAASAGQPVKLDGSDYRLLSEFRFLIRCFLEFSETAAVRAGLTTRQHQALLAIKGVRENAVPTIGYLANRLRIQHHSAVELVDRLAEAGMMIRAQDSNDRRRVKLELTDLAERQLAQLSSSHMAELERLRPALLNILEQAEAMSHDEGDTRCGSE
jgi:DNA-binding MarR family transcriptional regulator